jgi:hypothetical protein
MNTMPGVKRWIGNLSIARTLTAIGVVTSTTALLIAYVALVAYDVSSSRLDRESLMTRVNRDEKLLSAVIQVFLADCPQRLAAIRTAVDAGDSKRIRTTAHALAGRGRQFVRGRVG